MRWVVGLGMFWALGCTVSLGNGVAGNETGPCIDGACIGDLECLSGVCVAPDADSSGAVEDDDHDDDEDHEDDGDDSGLPTPKDPEPPGGSDSSDSTTSGEGTSGGSDTGDATTSSTSGTPPTTGTSTTTTGTSTTTGSSCGDGMVGLGEQCDGLDLQGFGCGSLGLGEGQLQCDPITCTFDTSMCQPPDSGTGSALD